MKKETYKNDEPFEDYLARKNRKKRRTLRKQKKSKRKIKTKRISAVKKLSFDVANLWEYTSGVKDQIKTLEEKIANADDCIAQIKEKGSPFKTEIDGTIWVRIG